MPLINRLACYNFLLLLLIYACAETSETEQKIVKAVPRPPVAIRDIENALTELSTDPLIKHGQLALSIKSTSTGKSLLEYNSDKSLVIASNMKLVTTATGLAVLGEDFTFKTELAHDGTLEANGTLRGNIYITGGGDPTLGSNKVTGSLPLNDLLDMWVNKLWEYGIRQVSGAIIADSELYNANAIPSGWTWADAGNYYGAPAFGLNFHDNLYYLYFKPGAKVGEAATILRTIPAIKEIQFVNEVTTGAPGSGDNAYIYGAPYTHLRYVQGTIPAGVKEFSIKGSLPEPGMTCAGLLHQKLVKRGIKIGLPATSVRLMQIQKKKVSTDRKPIYTHSSPALPAIVTETNLESVNLYAEAILKQLGIAKYEDGTTYSGTETVMEFWKQNGIDINGFFMRDGSGLSRNNSIRATTLTDILVYCAKAPMFASLYASLPVAGVSGTMKNIGKGTGAARNLHAKTGSLERVMSFSGYFTTRSGEMMSFAFIANDYAGHNSPMRKKMERLMALLTDLP
ncbi:D-alanyl-D-alanine carboxypeptidase/D-alanyl-D-alanine-endopeptidase [Rhodocytophaga aerolata]|uniref:D-alanyl-D-alanine carboxypeptidase/D-alanyl-D-alanine-endopeptidase n=1 Tax=Rhodocytophaga aerolata TaxID=455078 RepID=A0ABT8R1L7_9BACT|nr:D-alanyl-D-alanine carboxypeptidase/D-alanyl-D-alanine-endopeptidase [Rhodocytophaga aerolata]MDO1445996.1 D-alanyl-D-alanine carboxypeptidase/D-alanyl-D-alanine-endopeptidase [Rhodocytophaga aerolata]